MGFVRIVDEFLGEEVEFFVIHIEKSRQNSFFMLFQSCSYFFVFDMLHSFLVCVERSSVAINRNITKVSKFSDL